MQTMVMIALSLHPLAGGAWTLLTLFLAKSRGEGGAQLYWPLVGLGAVTIAAGGLLWGVAHRGVFGQTEAILAGGAACTLVAFALQALLGAALLAASRRAPEDPVPMRRLGRVQAAAGALLVAAAAAMLFTRYA